jgi:hypothetical protein
MNTKFYITRCANSQYNHKWGDKKDYPTWRAFCTRTINGNEVTVSRRFSDKKYGSIKNAEIEAENFVAYMVKLSNDRFVKQMRKRGRPCKTHYFGYSSLEKS